MRSYFCTKRHVVFATILVLLTLLAYSPIAQAKGNPSTTNAAPVISLGDTGTISIVENAQGSISLTAKDMNKDIMSWTITAAPYNGTAMVGAVTNSKGTSTVAVSYSPSLNYTGQDSFTVQVSDSKLTDTILIKVIISKTQISYVALGDSIATGTIYPGYTITSYVTYFHEYLKTQYPQMNVVKTSFATDGDRTNELYAKLGVASTGNAVMISAVENADVITISIGGNNLMQAAKDDTALGGYDFFNISITVADIGLKDFQDQWMPIIQKIKQLNPDVKLIVNTIYNPYDESDGYQHNTVDSYLFRMDGLGINDIIYGRSNLGYAVADVYKEFDVYKNNMIEVTYLYYRDLWESLTRNPHPRATGQTIITNQCEAAYQLVK